MTRLPVPPWRGDQVRAFHHLRQLAPRHDDHLLRARCRASRRRGAARGRSRRSACGSRSCALGLAGAVPGAGARARSATAGRSRCCSTTARRARGAVARADRAEAASTSCTPSSCARRPICRARRTAGRARSDRRAVGEPRAAGARRERGPLAPVAAWEATRLARFERALIARAAPLASSCRPRERDGARRRRARARWSRTASTLEAFPFSRRAAAAGAAASSSATSATSRTSTPRAGWRTTSTRACAPRCPAPSCASSARARRAPCARSPRCPGVSLAAAVPGDGAGAGGCDGRRGPDARRHRPPEQGPRGDGGRDARWSRRRAWRPALDVRAGRAPAGGRRRAGLAAATRRAAARPGARARHGARGARAGRAALPLGGLGRAVEAAWAAAVADRRREDVPLALRAIRRLIFGARAPARQGVAGSLGRAGRRGPAGGVPRLSAGLHPAGRGAAPAHPGLPAARSASPRSTTTGSEMLAGAARRRSTSSASTRRGRVLRPRAAPGARSSPRPCLQALVLIAVYFFRQDLIFPRSIFVVFAGAERGVPASSGGSAARRCCGGYPRRRVLVVGTNAAAAEVIETIRGQQWLGLDVVGIAVSSRNGTRPPRARGRARCSAGARSCPRSASGTPSTR